MSTVSVSPTSRSRGDQQLGCVLHIGMPKTATTTLQGFLFPRHPEVFFLGREYPADSNSPRHRHRNGPIHRLINELVYENWRAPDWELCRAIVEEHIEPHRAQGEVPVYSWESLVEDQLHVRRARAENLHRAFGRCQVIITLRHPVKLVESLYLQMLRRDNWGGPVRRGDPPRYETIDRWLEKNWGLPGLPPAAHLEYPETIEAYADVFGAENMEILLFEDFAADPECFLDRLCRTLGIDPQLGIQLTGGKRLNDRVTEEQIEKLRQVCRSPFRYWWFRYSDVVARRRQLGVPANLGLPSPGTPARPQMSPEWAERIAETVRPGHHRLLARWNLDLARHDYPL